MSLGEDRVRIRFNPSANDLVSQIKQKAAELIDLCEEHKNRARSELQGQELAEVFRWYGIAQTCFEDGAMWAVKAATIK